MEQHEIEKYKCLQEIEKYKYLQEVQKYKILQETEICKSRNEREKHNLSHSLETYKSLISISIESFKFLALANGGAAVALLAYLGNVAGKSVPNVDMSYPMFAFVLGLVFCGLSMIFGYATQIKLLNQNNSSKNFSDKHENFLQIAAVLYLLSLISFCFGAVLAVDIFN